MVLEHDVAMPMSPSSSIASTAVEVWDAGADHHAVADRG